MCSPYRGGYMTFVVASEGKNLPFNPKLDADGVPLRIVGASVYNEIEVEHRMSELLKRLILTADIDSETLNAIGFSRKDASHLSMDIDGLDHDDVPDDDDD